MLWNFENSSGNFPQGITVNNYTDKQDLQRKIIHDICDKCGAWSNEVPQRNQFFANMNINLTATSAHTSFDLSHSGIISLTCLRTPYIPGTTFHPKNTTTPSPPLVARSAGGGLQVVGGQPTQAGPLWAYPSRDLRPASAAVDQQVGGTVVIETSPRAQTPAAVGTTTVGPTAADVMVAASTAGSEAVGWVRAVGTRSWNSIVSAGDGGN
jgi:hypothetical protein